MKLHHDSHKSCFCTIFSNFQSTEEIVVISNSPCVGLVFFLSTGPMSRFSLQILNGALSTIFVRMSQRNKNKLVHFQSGQQKQNRIKLDCTGYFLVEKYHSMHLIHILQQKIIILICATYSSQQMSPLIQFNSYFVLDRWDLTNAFLVFRIFSLYFSVSENNFSMIFLQKNSKLILPIEIGWNRVFIF